MSRAEDAEDGSVDSEEPEAGMDNIDRGFRASCVDGGEGRSNERNGPTGCAAAARWCRRTCAESAEDRPSERKMHREEAQYFSGSGGLRVDRERRRRPEVISLSRDQESGTRMTVPAENDRPGHKVQRRKDDVLVRAPRRACARAQEVHDPEGSGTSGMGASAISAGAASQEQSQEQERGIHMPVRPQDEDDEEACHGAGGGRALSIASGGVSGGVSPSESTVPLSDPTDRSALLYIFKHTVRFGRPSIRAVVRWGRARVLGRQRRRLRKKRPLAADRRQRSASLNVSVDTYEWTVDGSDGVLRTGVWLGGDARLRGASCGGSRYGTARSHQVGAQQTQTRPKDASSSSLRDGPSNLSGECVRDDTLNELFSVTESCSTSTPLSSSTGSAIHRARIAGGNASWAQISALISKKVTRPCSVANCILAHVSTTAVA
ncbi:hypothetical protein B0H14DRAFT_3585269 [Mycena olivaceomarginata]|nr:hypothetical protein B0H14DRAFT_3585269 [Mycena olivaceomarginata]